MAAAPPQMIMKMVWSSPKITAPSEVGSGGGLGGDDGGGAGRSMLTMLRLSTVTPRDVEAVETSRALMVLAIACAFCSVDDTTLTEI